jgi:hypothetical protein
MNTFFKNPYLNAVWAECYILLVVLAINFFGKPNTPDTPFDGIAFLSLFTLSAGIMGFLFLGEPIQLFLNGQKPHAVNFFGKTIITFGVITFIALLAVRAVR